MEMLSSNGQEPTPAARILALMTRVVTLPALSARAGEPIRVQIRMATAEEVLAALDGPTRDMTPEDARRYLAELPVEERRAVDAAAEDRIEAFLRQVVIAPRICEQPDELTPPEGTIPYRALHADRFQLLQAVLDLSGFGGSFRGDSSAPVDPGGSDGAPMGVESSDATPNGVGGLHLVRGALQSDG